MNSDKPKHLTGPRDVNRKEKKQKSNSTEMLAQIKDIFTRKWLNEQEQMNEYHM